MDNGIVIDRVTVGYGFTQPTGNYENIRLDVSLSASVPPDKDHTEVFEALFKEAKITAEEQRREIIRSREV